jgi:hypothetical protein
LVEGSCPPRAIIQPLIGEVEFLNKEKVKERIDEINKSLNDLKNNPALLKDHPEMKEIYEAMLAEMNKAYAAILDAEKRQCAPVG